MKIIEREIKDLISAEYNPRKLNADQEQSLTDSLKRFGMVDPVIINIHKDRKDIIVGGHQRLKIWSKLGNKTIPTVQVDLSRDQERELNIRLNKNSGEWDLDILKSEFTTLELSDWGFDPEELLFFIDENGEGAEGLIDDDEIPELKESVTKKGDLWILGDHRLLCGDATSIPDLERLMGEKKADLLLTDPPYNVDYTGKTKDALKIENDKMSDPQFREFLSDSFANANHHMKEGGVFYIWHADSEGYNFRGACQDIGWQVRQCLIWNKNTMVMGRQDYHWKHEPCLYGWKPGAAHNWTTDRKQVTILDFDRPNRSEEHPTMKPVALFEYQLKNNTYPGESVLDLFSGSGTTLITAEKNGRVSFNMELDPKYCDVIVKRWEEFTGKKAELLSKTPQS